MIIVGMGKVGQQLLRALLRQGHDVAVVESRPELCARLSDETGARVVCGPGSDVTVLQRAGADRAHVLVAATGFDEENLVICRLAEEFCGVPRCVARVNDPRNEKVFAALGVPEAVSVTSLIAQVVEETATVGQLLKVHYLGKGKVEVLEVELPASSRLVGRRVAEVAADLPADCLFVSLVRGADVIICRGETVFAAGDTVLAVVAVGQEQPLRAALSP